MIARSYCKCYRRRQDGWTHLENQRWGHAKCRKVSKLVAFLEVLNEELNNIIERINTNQEAEDGLDKGRAEAICFAIAVYEDPEKPNIIAVKNRAVKRFRERNSCADSNVKIN